MSSLKSVFPQPVYLGAATRTPIGKFGGSLRRFTAPQLATLALAEARRRAPEVPTPGIVFLGHARQAGAGPNPARQAALGAGLPESVPAITVNQACASGLTAVISAVDKIAAGKIRSAWCGGVESMSNTPYFLMQARWGTKMGHGQVLDGMSQDGFFCPMSKMLMGETVERFLVPEFMITRREQDEFALDSQKKAEKAWEQGLFKAETFAIPAEGKLPGLERDEHPRAEVSMEQLAKLSAVFDPSKGTISAGNSSGITDGAAFIHLSDREEPHSQAEILDYEIVALDPRRMGLGPVESSQKILERQGLGWGDLTSVELNEAFAAQVIACQRTLKIPPEKLNPRGGAIALGHPIGATGTRLLVTLAHTLSGKPGALGLATLCVSGGMGVAVLIRSLK